MIENFFDKISEKITVATESLMHFFDNPLAIGGGVIMGIMFITGIFIFTGDR